MVTGTNGKTTTCYLVYQTLKKLGLSVAYLGTLGFFFQDEQIPLLNTTPEILTLYKLFLDAFEKGCTTVVMEVSSHALSLERINGIEFQVGAFTNFSEDHLDFYKTMDRYFKAKLKILDYMKPNGTFLVNANDEKSIEFIHNFSNTLKKGDTNADYEVKSFSLMPIKTNMIFTFKNKEYKVSTNLTGKFNIENYLFSVAICHALGYSLTDILKVSEEITAPTGRLEGYKVGEGYAIIDYAHTPDAVAKVIDTYQNISNSKIITVLGCGGDRDPLKRPIMGSIATEKSDYVIFTNDNPRTENEHKIINDILAGVNKQNYEVIYDRHEAIKKALDTIQKDDIVLILGKGHENYQILGTKKIYFSDQDEVRKYCHKKYEN